jgi:hypothetical protein
LPGRADEYRPIVKSDSYSIDVRHLLPDLRQPTAEKKRGLAGADHALRAGITLEDLGIRGARLGAQDARSGELEHAGLEIDECADHIECEDIEIRQLHVVLLFTFRGR